MPERSTEEKKAVILVTGGLAQGKLDWALARSGYTMEQTSPDPASTAPILTGLEELVRGRWKRAGSRKAFCRRCWRRNMSSAGSLGGRTVSPGPSSGWNPAASRRETASLSMALSCPNTSLNVIMVTSFHWHGTVSPCHGPHYKGIPGGSQVRLCGYRYRAYSGSGESA